MLSNCAHVGSNSSFHGPVGYSLWASDVMLGYMEELVFRVGPVVPGNGTYQSRFNGGAKT